MNKIIKVVSIIAGLAILIYIGRIVYMVICISCSPSPIKTYDYSGSMDMFEDKIRQFSAINSNVRLKITARDSTVSYSARDIEVHVKDNSDSVKYQLVLYDFNGSTKIDLEGIFDETRKTGGYNVKDKDVKRLFGDFKKDFLPKLEKEEGVVLKIDWFNF